MKIRKIFYLAAGLCAMPLGIDAQDVKSLTDVQRLYIDAKECFLLEDYSVAQQMLNQYLTMSSNTELREETDYMLACTAYELNQTNRFKLLNTYLEHYPASRYANRVKGLIASIYFEKGKYLEAIATFKGCNFEKLGKKERAEFIFKNATAYQKIGNLENSAFWFRLLSITSPEHHDDAIYHLAYIDYSKGELDKALQGFQSVENSKDYKNLSPYYIAEIYLRKGEYTKAIATAENFIVNRDNDKEMYEMHRIWGEAAYMQTDYRSAITHLETYRQGQPEKNRECMYKLGMSYFHTNEFTKAAPALEAATGLDDSMTQNAYLHMGLSYVQLRERNLARMAFERASTSSANMTIKEQALYNYALCIHETTYSPFAESVKVFERFLNEFPNSQYSSKVNDYLVEVYMNTRSYDVALQSISKIAYPNQRILEAKQKLLFRLGTQSFAQGKFEEATGYFGRSLELGRYNRKTKADAYYWRGESKYRLKQYGSAGNDMSMYLEFTPDKNSQEYGLALYNLGYVSFKQKKYDRALNWFRRCAESKATTDKAVKADSYNRMGDCYFHNRQFGEAAAQYAMAVSVDPSFGDYSLFQEAFVKGLQRDYTGKIRTLNRLITDHPKSQYIDDALYEQGRAFVQIKDNESAIERYTKLVEIYPESSYSRKAANEIGLLYYQDDKYHQAIDAYKKVISNYPGSDEARLAQRDLKSIYIDLNKVDDYAAFVNTIPGGANFDVNERDSLTYAAAEHVYMRGEMPEAKQSFERYIQTFPEGAFSVDASYYLGVIAYNGKKFDEAAQHLGKVIEFPNSKYSTQAMSVCAIIAYNNKEYDKSLSLYKRLIDKVTSTEDKLEAETGALRSAYLSKNDSETIGTASSLLSNHKLAPELENEARYYRAKAFATQGKGNEAMTDYQALAKDTRNVYGAEAKYKVAQIYFDNGQTDKAEKEVLDYIEVSTPHAYWLARGFVLLSDVYMKTGKSLEAKQYLLSLQQNYEGNDDIAEMIETRLKKLNKSNAQ